MDERKQKILHAIVQSYIATAEPVGSRTIARVYNLGISSATIRNEMQDLEWMGFLEQPHTSAGRIPSQKGYRFYVDMLMENDLAETELSQAIADWGQKQQKNQSKIFSEAAKLLAMLTHNLSVAIETQQSTERLNYIRFMPLDELRAILLVVTESGKVEHSLFPIPPDISWDELQHFAERVSNLFHHVPVAEITMEKLWELREGFLSPQWWTQAVTGLQASLSDQEQQTVYADGVSELIRQPEFQDMERIRQIIALVEESEKLADMLQPHGESGLEVRIGPETGNPHLQDYSIVQARFFDENRVLGTIAVLGPTRMDYGKVLAILHLLQQQIDHLIREK